MSHAAENLRELLSLARLLRRFAQEQTHDNHHVLFVATAIALEARAQLLATAVEAPAPVDLVRDQALHAPVNCIV
jgi:hypothetical protein